MSTATPKSRYLLKNGSIANVSYLHLGTGKWTLIGRRSTMWRNPPEVLGSSLEADTQGVGFYTCLIAPSRSIFGSNSASQYAASSGNHDGLWLWKGGGVARNGNETPLLIHCINRVEAPVLAQKFLWFLTTY
jgi:hypothetical protein